MASDHRLGVSEPLAEYVLGLAPRVITPEARGSVGFDEPVESRPDLQALDRLIAFSGRKPGRTQVISN